MVLSLDGKVHTMSYGSETQYPQRILGFGEQLVEMIATHSDGKHFLALTKNGTVYSWGKGVGGRLGHGDTASREEPKIIDALVGKNVVYVACGGTYSAAVTASGELYTWGCGSYGRLGHGNCNDLGVPTPVTALSEHKVVHVACGSGDSQTLCVTSTGIVFSWGDGDYGKLGRGGSDGSQVDVYLFVFL